MRRSHLLLAPVLIAVVVMLYQYFSAETFTNAETGERHRVALTSEQEAVLGLDAYEAVLSQAHVIEKGPWVDIVRRVASTLAKSTGESGASCDWRVSVVQSDAQNAFCLPGGKIVVYTGILPIAKTEAGLATVLGHEMAHATSRHSAQRLLREELTMTALMGAQGSLSDMGSSQRDAVMRVLGAGAQYGVILPFSRDHESEADKIGLHYMARAGYDPRESVRFWERMAELSKGQEPPEFASTHPSHATRTEDLQAEMPKALAEYERAKR